MSACIASARFQDYELAKAAKACGAKIQERRIKMFENKYQLTLRENIFLAKKNITRSVWSGVHLEGFSMTYPETETVLNHGKLKNADPDAVICANNLKRGWGFLLNNIEDSAPALDFDYMSTLNEIVAANDSLDPGGIRTGKGAIVGTAYRPPIKSKSEIEVELQKVLDIESATERAISLFLWGSKGQFFWDGNKRTAILSLNRVLIENGAGLLQITPDILEEFHTLLHNYYEHDNAEDLKNFLYESAIIAGDFESTREMG